jgi:hypothetical protein
MVMKKEYDFSKGEQGKFLRPGAKVSFGGRTQEFPKLGEPLPVQTPAPPSREHPRQG